MSKGRTNTAVQGFLIEGYQAGVLGGVQETEPFLDAIGVSHRYKAKCTSTDMLYLASWWHRDDPSDRILQHDRGGLCVMSCYVNWDAPRQTQLHSYWECFDHSRWNHTGRLLLRAPDHCGSCAVCTSLPVKDCRGLYWCMMVLTSTIGSWNCGTLTCIRLGLMLTTAVHYMQRTHVHGRHS